MANLLIKPQRTALEKKASLFPRDSRLPLHKAPSWLKAMSLELKSVIAGCLENQLDRVEEIRLRMGRPLVLRLGDKELTVKNDGSPSCNLHDGRIITRQDLDKNLEILSQNSLYAWEDEFKNGYLTIAGGHRVGLAGRAVLEQGVIKTLKDISGLNYRIGREVIGCADKVIPFVLEKQSVLHTLVVSPPQCGKTTLLRDMIRQISDGIAHLQFKGVNVGLVDERSEIAGAYEGQPQFRIGLRTDILDACPKAQGMIMLVRSMSPRVIATDEIGKSEDIEALHQTLQSGVSVLTTVHGASIEEIGQRPVLRDLLKSRFFERIIVLSRRKGAGTLEAVYNGKSMERLC